MLCTTPYPTGSAFSLHFRSRRILEMMSSMRMMRSRSLATLTFLVFVFALGGAPQTAAPAESSGAVNQSDLREWLGYIASDELEGRQVFTEGLGLAAGYIAEHLAAWNVKPA